MTKYRKKPVVIEAFRVPIDKNDSEAWGEIAVWLGAGGSWYVNETAKGCGIAIQTLEGTMQADPLDYIIRGVKGELYPCKPDIFNMTYELVE